MKLIRGKMTIQNAMRKLREIAHPITANHFLEPQVELKLVRPTLSKVSQFLNLFYKTQIP
jgi:hypothetical protein